MCSTHGEDQATPVLGAFPSQSSPLSHMLHLSHAHLILHACSNFKHEKIPIIKHWNSSVAFKVKMTETDPPQVTVVTGTAPTIAHIQTLIDRLQKATPPRPSTWSRCAPTPSWSSSSSTTVRRINAPLRVCADPLTEAQAKKAPKEAAAEKV